jgi:hypothetical protein
MAFPQFGRSLIRERNWSALVDALVFAAILAGIYAVLATVKYWMGVVTPAAHISRSPARRCPFTRSTRWCGWPWRTC